MPLLFAFLFLTLTLEIPVSADPFPADGRAPQAESPIVDPAAPVARAARVGGGIVLDGRLDEADWAEAGAITDFTQFEPVEGAAPSQPTEVRVLYGESALYVGAVLFDDEPGAIVTTLSRRDQPSLADRFWVQIDSYFDRKTAFAFGVSAAGVQMDGIVQDGRRGGRRPPGQERTTSVTQQVDLSWDAVWSSEVALTREGWSVELRIPYSMLRFTEAEQQTWGVNFRREIARLSEVDDWVMISRRESGSVRHFGRLEGLDGIRPRRNVQVTPYSISRTTSAPGAGGRTIGHELDLGADLKVGLSSSVTLDATINPDFGQVEADPAELNLTTFETFFPEKRPFFTEGVQIFEYDLGFGPEGSLLYTRRVGAGVSPIIGAAKLSGRTQRGLSFGLFGAATGQDFDPERSYGVVRVKQEFGAQSHVGAMLTGFGRRGTLQPARRSVAGGVDWSLRLLENAYEFKGNVTGTTIAHPEIAAPAETGFGTSAALERMEGTTTWLVSTRIFSDRFDPNDLGRLRQNDWMRITAGLTRLINDNEPFGPFRRASIRTFHNYSWSYRTRTDLGYTLFAFASAETNGFHRITISSFDTRFGGYDVRETRGLGPYRNPGVLNLMASVSTDSRLPYTIEPGVRFTRTGSEGTNWGAMVSGSWTLGARLNLFGQIGVTAESDVPAWAANEPFARIDGRWHVGPSNRPPGALAASDYSPLSAQAELDAILSRMEPHEGTAGLYYVPLFGSRDTRSADFTLRSNITFTRTMSLQLYTQLFVAKGRFDRFRVLAAPDELAAFDGYPKRHDFALNSFSSNVVFRWEYRPGSALFLVWSQGRFGHYRDAFPFEQGSPFAPSVADRMMDTFSIFPTDVVMIKLNYLFLR